MDCLVVGPFDGVFLCTFLIGWESRESLFDLVDKKKKKLTLIKVHKKKTYKVVTAG